MMMFLHRHHFVPTDGGVAWHCVHCRAVPTSAPCTARGQSLLDHGDECGPVKHVVAFLGRSEVGCVPRGCLAFALTQRELAREYAAGRVPCRLVLNPGWNRPFCLAHCSAWGRVNFRSLVNKYLLAKYVDRPRFARTTYVHFPTAELAVWYQRLLCVKQTCCGGKGFRPTRWRRNTPLLLNRLQPWWRQRVGRRRRVDLLRTLWWYVCARFFLVKLRRVRGSRRGPAAGGGLGTIYQ